MRRVFVLSAVLAMMVAGASADTPFLYGEKPKPATAPAPVVPGAPGAVGVAVDKDWKPVPGAVPANLPDPTPAVDKHKLHHQPPQLSIAHLKEVAPKAPRVVKDEGVRAHVFTREPEPVAPEPVTVRAHVVTPDAPRPPRQHHYVYAHSVESSSAEKRVPRKHEYVVANAHISRDAPVRKVKRTRELVSANAHIDAPVPRTLSAKRARDIVVANAHITTRPPRSAPRARRPREFVTPVAHITAEPRRRRAPKVRAEREIVSADVNIWARGDASPSKPAPREPKPEPELVSADIKVV